MSPSCAASGSRVYSGPAHRLTTSCLSCVRKRRQPAGQAMIDELLQRFRNGDRLALARLLSLAARGEHCAAISAALPRPARPALVAAFTGSGGVGKSSLIG